MTDHSAEGHVDAHSHDLALIAALRAENAELRQTIDDLRARLGLDVAPQRRGT